jgi:hypothetical protein
MHSTPTDLTFSCEPLPESFGYRASFPEGLRDPPGISIRVARPISRTGGRVNTDDSSVPDFQIAQLPSDPASLPHLFKKAGAF